MSLRSPSTAKNYEGTVAPERANYNLFMSGQRREFNGSKLKSKYRGITFKLWPLLLTTHSSWRIVQSPHLTIERIFIIASHSLHHLSDCLPVIWGSGFSFVLHTSNDPHDQRAATCHLLALWSRSCKVKEVAQQAIEV